MGRPAPVFKRDPQSVREQARLDSPSQAKGRGIRLAATGGRGRGGGRDREGR